MRTELDGEIAAVVERIERAGVPEWHALSVESARRIEDEVFGGADPPPVDLVRDLSIPGDGGELPVRVYRPDAETPAPVVVFYHGGGWTLGTLEDAGDARLVGRHLPGVRPPDGRRRRLRRLPPRTGTPVPGGGRRRLRSAVLGRRVRRCGRRRPGPPRRRRDERGREPRRGDGAARTGRGRPRPRGTGALLPDARRRRTRRRGGRRRRGRRRGRRVLRGERGRPVADPARRCVVLEPVPPEFRRPGEPVRGARGDRRPPGPPTRDGRHLRRGLPPATVVTCGHDPLRDEGADYAEALDDAGVDVDHLHYPSVPHGVLSLADDAAVADEAFDEVAASLRARL